MILTAFLSIIICAAISIMLISAIVFIQDSWMFSSAPKEVKEVLIPRDKEVFYGAKAIGWLLMIFSILMILCAFVIAFWDGLKNGFTFWQFFMRFEIIFTIYKIYDMIFFDYYLLMKFHFFQYFFPEVKSVLEDPNRKYGFNIKSQLAKLFVVFPVVSALLALVCNILIR